MRSFRTCVRPVLKRRPIIGSQTGTGWPIGPTRLILPLSDLFKPITVGTGLRSGAVGTGSEHGRNRSEGTPLAYVPPRIRRSKLHSYSAFRSRRRNYTRPHPAHQATCIVARSSSSPRAYGALPVRCSPPRCFGDPQAIEQLPAQRGPHRSPMFHDAIVPASWRTTARSRERTGRRWRSRWSRWSKSSVGRKHPCSS
jgi:hypothetical protein